HTGGRGERGPVAEVERLALPAGGQQPAVEVEDRRLVGPQRLDVADVGRRRPRQPWVVGAPTVRGGSVPGDRRATPVPPARVDDALGWHDRVLQPELLALEEERRAPERQQQDGGGARPGLRAVARAM